MLPRQAVKYDAQHELLEYLEYLDNVPPAHRQVIPPKNKHIIQIVKYLRLGAPDDDQQSGEG